MTFKELGLSTPILRAADAEGYTSPTPIQAQSIPVILRGRDILGTAQTGTGKTAAYAMPILQLLSEQKPSEQKTAEQAQGAQKNSAQKREGKPSRVIRALILAPTRELSLQIKESFDAYGKFLNLRYAVVYGGVSQVPQQAALKSGVDILIATPGRLLDLMGQKLVRLERVQFFVLDEADRMLDMGFIHDVNRIITRLPVKRQTMLFSATMPMEILELSGTLLKDPEQISVAPVTSTVDTVRQELYYVDKFNKRSLLLHLLENKEIVQALVFSRTKYGANKIAEFLSKKGIRTEAIHGNKSQGARQKALNDFKQRRIRVLVATDIAARGIDVTELSHVINFDLPNESETYIHRIGRTGRAGQSGVAISFCDEEETEFLKSIERLTRQKIPVVEEHPFPPTWSLAAPVQENKKLTPNNMRSFGYGRRGGHRGFGRRK